LVCVVVSDSFGVCVWVWGFVGVWLVRNVS
jgi:hypothetical protein